MVPAVRVPRASEMGFPWRHLSCIVSKDPSLVTQGRGPWSGWMDPGRADPGHLRKSRSRALAEEPSAAETRGGA